MPWFPSESGVLESGDGSDPTGRLRHGGNLPSSTPIAFGLMIGLIGLWLLTAAINTPLVYPSRADGAEVRGSCRERTFVPFPRDLTGDVDVVVDNSELWLDCEQGPVTGTFVVVDQHAAVIAREDDLYFSGVPIGEEGHRLALSLSVPENAEYRLVAPRRWGGHVAFLRKGHYPSDPDWRWILQAASAAAFGTSLATIWGLRRRRWRRELVIAKEQLRAAGFDPD